MAGELKIHSALLLDNYRLELGGAVSLIGVVPDGIVEQPEFPAYQRLAVALVADAVELGKVTLFVKFRFNGDVKWIMEFTLEVEAKRLGLVLPIGETNASFDKPGDLELLVSRTLEDDGEVVCSWTVAKLQAADA